jgi:hypothetical protein
VKLLAPAVLLTGAVLTGMAVTGCAHGTPAAGPSAVPSHAANAAETVPGGCPTGTSLPLPKEFPATLPVPEHATVTSVEHRSGNRLVVNTVVHGGFRAALSFMQQRLPKAGYTPAEGEVEKYDAESNFSSATVAGRWTLRAVPGCPGGVYLTYLTSPKS